MEHPNSKYISSLRKLTQFIGPSVALIGLMALMGWVLGEKVLTSLTRTFTPMNPTVAVCFILTGFSFWFVVSYPSKPLSIRIFRSVGFLIFLTGLCKLSELIFGWDTRIDEVLFPYQSQSTQIAPNTSIGLILIGFSYFSSKTRWDNIYELSKYGALACLPLALFTDEDAPSIDSGFITLINPGVKSRKILNILCMALARLSAVT